MNYSGWGGTPADDDGLAVAATSAKERAQWYLSSTQDDAGDSLAGFRTSRGATDALTSLPQLNGDIEAAITGAGMSAMGQMAQAKSTKEMYEAAAKAAEKANKATQQKKSKGGFLSAALGIGGSLVGGPVGGLIGGLGGLFG